MTTFPISPLSSNPTNFITAASRPLRHLRSGHMSLAQTQAVLSVPSTTKIQVTHLSITNSSRYPNIETFGHVALSMSLGGHSKVFVSTRAPTPVSSSRNWMSQKDARIRMAVLFAIIILRRTNHTGLSSLWVAIAFVRMLQGIQPCECKGNGHQWLGNQVFRLAEDKKKWDLWKRSPKTFWGI